MAGKGGLKDYDMINDMANDRSVKPSLVEAEMPSQDPSPQDLESAIRSSGYHVAISHNIYDPSWDEFLAKAPGGHHVQSSLWAQVKAINNWKAIRIIITRDEQIVAGAQLLMRSIMPLLAFAYLTKGPVLIEECRPIAETIIRHVVRISQENHIQMLAIQPPNNGAALISLLLDCGFQPSSLELAPAASFVLDLAPTEDWILGQMKRQTRQNIRRSEREGVTVREGNAADLDVFYRLHIVTAHRQRFTPYPLKYFRKLWDVFEPHHHIGLFLAEHHGVPISALLIIPFGNTVIAKILGWSGEYSQLKPNDAVFWHAIRWSKLHGFQYFDFEGVELQAAKAILAGGSLPESLQHSPDFLKMGFGGRVVLYPLAYDTVHNRVFRWIYKKASPKVGGRSAPSQLMDRLRKR